MKDLVVPTEIPYKSLTGSELEECLYWLLNAMGAKELEWRVGGTGPGTSDGGRDIEASFFVSSPDGEMQRERWWIEAKGRSKTVEPEAVKQAAINAVDNSEIDVLIIATNSVFSNPTRDWLKNWQANHQRPKVRLWDKHSLERMLAERPEVVLRLFSRALTTQGRLAVVRTHFWDYVRYADANTLATLWKCRDELDWGPQDIMAVVASEFANGDIRRRPWLLRLDDNEVLVIVFSMFLVNFLSFISRARLAGTDEEPYVAAIVQLIHVFNLRFSADAVVYIVNEAWNWSDTSFPDEIKESIARPVVARAFGQIYDLCFSDCSRIMRFDTERLSKDEQNQFWDQFRAIESEKIEIPERDDHRELVMESYEGKCHLGLAFGNQSSCPLFSLDASEDSIEQIIRTTHRIMKMRRPADLKV